jgi:hypothetical protein
MKRSTDDATRLAGIREALTAANGDWQNIVALWSINADLTWLLEQAERAARAEAIGELPPHAPTPRTAAGRRLLGKNAGSDRDPATVEWLANDIWAIETEAMALDAERAARAQEDAEGETETCPTCWQPVPIPQRGDHDYGLRLSRAARAELGLREAADGLDVERRVTAVCDLLWGYGVYMADSTPLARAIVTALAVPIVALEREIREALPDAHCGPEWRSRHAPECRQEDYEEVIFRLRAALEAHGE